MLKRNLIAISPFTIQIWKKKTDNFIILCQADLVNCTVQHNFKTEQMCKLTEFKIIKGT